MEPSTFAERVRLLRSRKKWTQEQLAERCGVKANTVIRWEGGKTAAPQGANLQALADALDTTAANLLTGSDSVSSSPQLDEARRYAAHRSLQGEEAAFVYEVARLLERTRRVPDGDFMELVHLAFRSHTNAV